jgi:hypothetical protein
LIALLISIAAVSLVFLLYYKNLKFAPLRILSIALLYILISGFALTLQFKKERNLPALLVDHSASMSKYFPSVIKKIEQIHFPHTRFYFSESLFLTTPEAVSPSGRFTDITGAIVEVNKLNPSAIILLSDGNHNYGKSPLSIVEDIKIPIYCFGVGSEYQRDVEIVDVAYPDYVYMGDSVKVEVVIQSKGFTGGKGRVEFISEKKKSQYRSFPLSDIKAKQNINFWVSPSHPEKNKFRIRVAPQPAEENYENNKFEFSLNVLKEKIKVLYYTEHVSFNTKFMLRTLDEDNHIDFDPIIKISEGNYVNARSHKKHINLPSLNKFDVLIVDNINLNRFPWPNIKQSMTEGLGILCMGKIDGYSAVWRDILPIHTAGVAIKGNYYISVEEPFSCLMPGDDYPPFLYLNRMLGVKENAVVIAETNKIPVIAYQRHGQSVVFQLNAIDIGTWQFLQTGLKQKNILSCFITDVVRFVSPAGMYKRLVLKSVNKEYKTGDVIELTLQSFDRNFKLAGGGDFYVEYGDRKIPFFEVRKGVYKNSLIAEKGGKFRLQALGKLADEILNSNVLEINVAARAIESEQGLNREFLQTLSARTNGKYYSIDELDNFTITLPEETVVKKLDFDSPLSYLIIVCLLAVDWVLRKRQGMI